MFINLLFCLYVMKKVVFLLFFFLFMSFASSATGTLRMYVYDNSTKNLTGNALVQIYSQNGSFIDQRNTYNSGKLYANFAALNEGKYTAVVIANGFINQSLNVVVTANVTSKYSVYLNKIPIDAGSLRIFAYDSLTQKVMSSAMVYLYDLNGKYIDQRSTSRGYALFSFVPVGKYNVVVSNSGYSNYTLAVNV